MLNDRILARVETIEERAILELGAGIGYFAGSPTSAGATRTARSRS